MAYRTGRLAHLWRELVAAAFNVPIASGLPGVFVEPEVIKQLQGLLTPPSD